MNDLSCKRYLLTGRFVLMNNFGLARAGRGLLDETIAGGVLLRTTGDLDARGVGRVDSCIDMCELFGVGMLVPTEPGLLDCKESQELSCL